MVQNNILDIIIVILHCFIRVPDPKHVNVSDSVQTTAFMTFIITIILIKTQRVLMRVLFVL